MGVLKKNLGAFGSSFAFEFFLEMARKDIVEGLAAALKDVKPEDVPALVAEQRFPPLHHFDFSAVGDNAEHLERISVGRLMDWLAEARPDLAGAIIALGMPGAEYIVKLRLHLLEGVSHPERAKAKSVDYLPAKATALAVCDKCGKRWPVAKAGADQITVCPFCGA